MGDLDKFVPAVQGEPASAQGYSVQPVAKASLPAQPSMVGMEYVFDFTPGKLGLVANWETGVVTEVSPGEQADRHGIKAGWKIVKLDDSTYSESNLDALIAGSRTYSVTFSMQEVPETVTVYLPIIDKNGVTVLVHTSADA